MIWIKLVKLLIELNESIIFYPKLKRFYKNYLVPKISNNHVQPIIFDVGANRGQSILFFQKVFENASYEVFEPNKKLFNFLKLKFKGRSNFSFYDLGLSNVSGEMTFFHTLTDETSTFEKLNPESSYMNFKAKVLGTKVSKLISAEEKVKVITLSDFLNQHKIEMIDLLKIDTEGHELKVLKGLFDFNNECFPQFIQIENHYNDMYLDYDQDGTTNYLLSKGYSIAAKIRHGFGNFYEIIFEYSQKKN